MAGGFGARFSPHPAGFLARMRVGGAACLRRSGVEPGVLPLPRFAKARKASALRADDLRVREKLAVFLLVPLLALASFAAGPESLIRKRVSEVQLTLVATDQHNRPLLGLSPSDIVVLEDGQPVPKFELRSASDLPLRIGVVLDLSDSTLKSWALLRTALLGSLQKLMRPGDRLLIVAFNSKIQLEQTLTSPEELGTAMQLPAVGGLTALYDTVYTTCDHPLFRADRNPHRSALILFSDGEDDVSLHGLGDSVARAQRNGVAIYTVTTHSPKKQLAGDFVLREFAANTGGRDFIVKDSLQLQGALSAINDELRNSYVLYYRVPQESGAGSFRRVRVVSTQNQAFQLRSRPGYFTTP